MKRMHSISCPAWLLCANMDPTAFTVREEKIRLNKLITRCGICKVYDPVRGGEHPPVKTFQALWDTGATNSVITKVVVDKLGLSPIGMGRVYTPQGEAITNMYLVNLLLPNNIGIPSLTVRIVLIISTIPVCRYQMQYLLIQKGYFLTIPYLPC